MKKFVVALVLGLASVPAFSYPANLGLAALNGLVQGMNEGRQQAAAQAQANPAPQQAVSAAAPAANAFVVRNAEAMAAELRKSEFATSRCMLTPVFAGDGMTVALSTDRIFASNDVIVGVGEDKLDPSVKFPVRAVLMKHGPSEQVSVRVRRSGKELTVTAMCADAKPFYDAQLEGAFAMSKGDAARCSDKFGEASRIHALNVGPMNLAYNCAVLAGRFVTPADTAKSYYEVYRHLILESQWSSDSLGNNRANILTAVDFLNKKGAAYLADDLKSQYDQAVAAKAAPTPTTASIAGGQRP